MKDIKAAIFYDKNMPYEGERPSIEDFNKLQDFADILTLDNFKDKQNNTYDVIVNLHGSVFIKDSWHFIKRHINNGAGLLNIGSGTPFSEPLSYKNGSWIKEHIQTAYHEELNIRHALAVSKDRYDSLKINEDMPVLKGFEKCFDIKDTIGMIVQFTKYKDMPKDGGSSGPLDAYLFPLLTGYGENERKMAAPAVMIENTKGTYAGGRWIFINQAVGCEFWNNGGAELINSLCDYLSKGVYEFILRPNYASYYPGEQPTLLMQAQNLSNGKRDGHLNIEISKDNEVILNKEIDITFNEEINYTSIPLDFHVDKGFYKITAKVDVDGESIRVYTNGFVGYDKELMESGSELTCNRDYFVKDGKPMPIVGMTYMQSDVHRKYIYLPNVARWDEDLKEMKKAGINMVRTGIWTGFRTVMFNDGVASEEILRAFDGLFMTAKKYDIHICLNFFAFTPESWEGVNPYLDPRSIEAQKRYISSIVSRHKNSKGVSWDLINEPSLCHKDSHWAPVPNGDMYEVREWHKWLKERHKDIKELQGRWNVSADEMPSFESATLPSFRDFATNPAFTEPFHGLKTIDYILFTQDVMVKWEKEMVKAIRATGSKQLVTVGQDEGLGARRPSPFFYQEGVDYTTCHSWWLNDDLYWDGIFSKTPNKPNLIQETGIMYVQNADSSARRTEAELRDILERKYALAFAADNAGAIHWVWNMNIYMDSVNEVNIGAVRADGTQKLEADVSYDFGDFIKDTGYLFKGRKLEDVSVIFPYSNNFSPRDYASTATKKIARIFGYNLNIPIKAYGEYDLNELKNDKLVVVPSPRTLSDYAWNTIMDKVKNGSYLLITGPLNYNEYYDYVDRTGSLGIKTTLVNIKREECLVMEGKTYRVPFGGDKIAWVDKESIIGEDRPEVKLIDYGKGKVIWSPIPVEVGDNEEVIEDLYAFAAKCAGVKQDFKWISGKNPGILGKKLCFDEGSVYVFVSEYAYDDKVSIFDNESKKTYSFIIPSNRVVLFAIKKNGNVTKSYRNINIEID